MSIEINMINFPIEIKKIKYGIELSYNGNSRKIYDYQKLNAEAIVEIINLLIGGKWEMCYN